jgi:ubiquinone/menaquinone biosynthesis C-methylase UbiE
MLIYPPKAMLTTATPQLPSVNPTLAGNSRRKRRTIIKCTAQQTNASDKAMPDWTGEGLLSKAVNAAINFPPLFGVMKIFAKNAIQSTAQKNGVPWSEAVTTLSSIHPQLDSIKSLLEDPSLSANLPGYYTVPFHGYDTGNLSWLAAYEVEPATQAMALRVWKDEAGLTPEAAQKRLRRGILDAVNTFREERNGVQGGKDVGSVLDVGCSVGVSTRWLAAEYPEASITGIDLSPYFLAIAELREKELFREEEEEEKEKDKEGGIMPVAAAISSATSMFREAELAATPRQRINYLHLNAESTGLPDASFDLISLQFIIHECPGEIIDNLVKEAKRLLSPGGVLAIADNNPRSKVIQGLPPVLFTLMKSTEPHSDSYYAYDVEECMKRWGFSGVNTVESDPRHRTVLGICV